MAPFTAVSTGASNPAELLDGLPQASEGYAGPVEQTIKRKLVELLNPTVLRITNDSHLHSHHAAMRAQGGGSGETHFSVLAVSSAFEGKRQMQRHRMIYAALDEELKREGGVHALVLETRTPAEAAEAQAAP